MPHFFGDILVVTKDELVPEFYTANNLSVTLYRYKDKPYGPKRAQLGGNGRELLVIYDSLPQEIQDKLGDPRKPDHLMDQFYKVDLEDVKFYSEKFTFEDGQMLSLDAQDKHITNASMLKACIALENARRTEWRNLNRPKGLRGLRRSVFNDYLHYCKHKESKSPDAFQCTLPRHYNRWLPVYKTFKKAKDNEQALRSIVKRYRSNTNAQVVREDVEEKLLNDLFATQPHKPYVSEIAKQYDAFLSGYLEIVNQQTGELYDPKEYRAVSERTIQNYLTKWENTIGTHAKRSGNRQELMGKFSPYHSFTKPKFAGSLLSIDDRQPPFEYEKGKRMWFYLGLDAASEAITCFVFGKTKEGIILDFYQQLIRNYHHWGINLPDALECESSLNSSFKDTFLREGYMFQNVRIEPNNARGKLIERYNGLLRYGIEKEEMGWIARPFARSEANRPGSQTRQLIPYNRLAEERIKNLQDWNNMPHSEYPHMTRWEYFLENQHPDLKKTNYRAIMPYVGNKTTTSVNLGIIRLQNREWLLGNNGSIATGDALIRLMKQIEGYDIDVYWLDDWHGNVFQAHVYIGNQFICEAISKPMPNRAPIERTEEDMEQMALFAHYKATIDSYQRMRKNLLEPVAVINQKPKTLNSKFIAPQFIGKKKASPTQTDEALELELVEDDSLSYEPQENSGGSWRSAFES